MSIVSRDRAKAMLLALFLAVLQHCLVNQPMRSRDVLPGEILDEGATGLTQLSTLNWVFQFPLLPPYLGCLSQSLTPPSLQLTSRAKIDGSFRLLGKVFSPMYASAQKNDCQAGTAFLCHRQYSLTLNRDILP